MNILRSVLNALNGALSGTIVGLMCVVVLIGMSLGWLIQKVSKND